MKSNLTQIVEAGHKSDGTVIFDGDGDGTSAAAIWLINRPGNYIAITNQQKSDRKLVKRIFDQGTIHNLSSQQIGVFDIAAEDNVAALEKLSKTGADVHYIDHHTRDQSLIPRLMNNHCVEDNRMVSSASISYEVAVNEDRLRTAEDYHKAKELTTIGLANDKKSTASKRFGLHTLSEEHIAKLIKYAGAINFGSQSGKLDSTELFKGFVRNQEILPYLVSSQEVNHLVKDRLRSIKSVFDSARKYKEGSLELYVLPNSTQEERVLSTGAYPEILGDLTIANPSIAYVCALRTPKGDWKMAGRDPNALGLMNTIARHYGKVAKGRQTAAGFVTSLEVDIDTLWNQLKEAFNEK